MSRRSADHERLRSLSALLEVVLSLAENERGAWLTALPLHQQIFVPQLASLLARASIETDDFMRHPVGVRFDELHELEVVADQAGDAVGPYRLIRELGSGGMATVWLAERIDGLLQRQVALKLPRETWALGLAKRMAREREILGALEHTYIARLYEAGVTDSGRPWMAMEFVSGTPIDQHCRERGLGVPQRLRLFLQVAEAVAYAHARLIVHRDLKPSNILVTLEGEVRLLDFGVAKILEQDPAVTASLTQLMGRAVTPDYASPEQVSGRPVGVATDVYSLGVVLYELLTGQRPYRTGRATAAALEEAILTADVRLASSSVHGDRVLARQLRGDLDTILAKALKRESAQRYVSVESMAADVDRHLRGEPVRAIPDSTWYRTRKFLGRHRWSVAAAASATAALAFGLGVSLWQARAIERERDRADTELAQSQGALEFFNVLLTEEASDEQTEVLKQLLAKGESVAASIFRDSPDKEALALMMLVEYHGHFGEAGTIEPLLRRAAFRAGQGGDPTLRASVECALGRYLTETGKLDEARTLLDRWLGSASIGPETRASCYAARGFLARQSSDAAGALRFAEGASASIKEVRFPPAWLPAEIEGDLGYAFSLNGRYEEAEDHLRRALVSFETNARSDSTGAHNARIRWARLLYGAGNPRQAMVVLGQVAAAYERLSGAHQPLPAVLLDNLALGHELSGELALAAEQSALALASARQAGNHALVASALVGQASVERQQGRLAEARRLLSQAEQAMANKVPDGNPADMRRMLVLGQLELDSGQAGRAEDAAKTLLSLLDVRKVVDFNRVAALCLQGEAAMATSALDRARNALDQCLALAKSMQGAREYSLHVGQAWLGLGRLEQVVASPAAAKAALQNAVLHLEATTAPTHPRLLLARELLARAG